MACGRYQRTVVRREALRAGDPISDALPGPVLDHALAGVKAIAEELDVDPAHLLVVLARTAG